MKWKKGFILILLVSPSYLQFLGAEELLTGILPSDYLPASPLKENFHSYGKTGESCPNNMIDMGSFCIDQTSQTNNTWAAAAQKCHEQNKKLCSHSEWIVSCQAHQKGEAEIIGIASNPEWVDGFAALPGEDGTAFQPLMRGYQGNCYFIDTKWPSGPTDQAYIRCCSSK